MDFIVDGFDWDDGNREKCRKHGVSIVEIESVFRDDATRVQPDVLNSTDEQRFRAIGRTTKGRAVFLVFTVRDHASHRLIRPISARYMHSKEIAAYEKENP